jgi:hypothetical protein
LLLIGWSEELHMMSVVETKIEASARPKTIERRHNPRYAFVADVEIIDAESGITIAAHTSDLSRGGCYVDTFNPFPEHTAVTLRLRKWRETLEARAQVVYSSEGLGMGLMFGVFDTPERAIIEKWLTQLCGARAC